ncbi:MAG: GNAT family N-acetyltransferase [Verrucomicrobiota bacterium]
MSLVNYRIRRLEPGEFDLYRRLRLESLRESPEAFLTSLESALARDEASWTAQADGSASGPDRATFVVLVADAPAGLAALYRDSVPPTEGELMQVWVAPSLRGSGAAAALMDAVFEWAASNNFMTVRAEIARSNPGALSFYKKHGFIFPPSRTDSETEPWLLIRHCHPQS